MLAHPSEISLDDFSLEVCEEIIWWLLMEEYFGDI